MDIRCSTYVWDVDGFNYDDEEDKYEEKDNDDDDWWIDVNAVKSHNRSKSFTHKDLNWTGCSYWEPGKL